MDKAYNEIVFHNDQSPDLDEINMNAISHGLSVVDDRVIQLKGDFTAFEADNVILPSFKSLRSSYKFTTVNNEIIQTTSASNWGAVIINLPKIKFNLKSSKYVVLAYRLLPNDGFEAISINLDGTKKFFTFTNSGYSSEDLISDMPDFDVSKINIEHLGNGIYNLSDGVNLYELDVKTSVKYSNALSFAIGIIASSYFPANVLLAKWYDDTFVAIDKIKSLIEKESNRWVGKKGAFVGDSITAQGYYTSALERMGIVVQNVGSSGSTFTTKAGSNMILAEINKISDDVDFIFVLGGTNDWGLNALIGDYGSGDSNVFYGGLRVTLEAIRNKFPTKPIFMSTILPRNWHGTGQYAGIDANGNNKSIMDFNEAIKRYASRYGIIIFDGFTDAGICLKNIDTYTSDGLHLNTLGGERFATWLLDRMSVYSNY